MRLISAQVRGYRVHDDLAVEFAPGRTVLVGPNESGKSTLVEALHRVLMMHHRSGGDAWTAMQSNRGANRHPEVVLRFSAAGSEWRLRKLFRSSSGSVCELANERTGESWTADDAEQRLGELTGHVPRTGLRAAQLAERWDHLWVFQGAGHADAFRSGAEELSAALAGSRADSGAVAMLTGKDRAVLAAVQALVDKEWNKQRSDLLRGGEAGAAQARSEAAAAALDTVKREQEARQKAADGLVAAKEDLERQAAVLAGLRSEAEPLRDSRVQLATAASEVADAERKVAKTKEQVEQRLSLWEQRSAKAAELATLEAQIADAQKRSQRTEDECKALEGKMQDTQRAAQDAAKERDQLDLCCHLGRLHEELRMREELRQAAAEEVTQQEGREQALRDREAELAKLPRIDAATLENLRHCEREALDAAARLDLLATVIERTSGASPVLVDGRPLGLGDPLRIKKAAVLSLADGTELRIVPGGEELPQMRAKASAAQQALHELLAQTGVPSHAEAQRVSTERAALERSVAEARTKAKCTGKPPAERLAGHEASIQELDRQIRRLEKQGVQAPSDLHGCKAQLDAVAQMANRHQQDQLALGNSLRQLQQARDQGKQAEHELRIRASVLGSEVDQLGRELGDEAAHRQALDALAQQVAALEETARQKGRRRGELQQAADRWDAVQRTIVALEATIQELERKRSRFEGELGNDQGRDFAAEVEARQEEAELAAARALAARRRADGAKLLLERLQGLRQRQREQHERPFLDACGRYLSIAFGEGAALWLDGEDQERGIGAVEREAAGLARCDFANLSMGAKELVALAVRLAMAETLAASQPDGCLPLVLDDSVTNVDPERRKRLGQMLVAASGSGVQIVCATCETNDYVRLLPERIVTLPQASA